MPSFIQAQSERSGRAPEADSQLRQRVVQASKAFDYGDCPKVIDLLSGTQYIPYVDDEETFVKIYKVLAICYFQLKQKDKAEKELQNLLILRPKVELDPFTTPPPILELFAKIKIAMAVKIEEIEKARAKIAESEKAKNPIKKRIIRRTSPLAAFVPFGYGQFENQDTLKGAIIASTETVLLGVNIGSYWWKRSYILPNSNGLVADSAAQTNHKTAQILQFVSLGLLAGTYIYGVIDALIYRKPFVEEEIPDETRKGG